MNLLDTLKSNEISKEQDSITEQKGQMVEPATWEEFRKTGLLWYINQMLQPFGWSIMVSLNESGNIVDCSPCITKFRGFSEDVVNENNLKLAIYMKDNAERLLNDVKNNC